MYCIVQPFWIDESNLAPIRPFLAIVEHSELGVVNPKASRRFLALVRRTVFQLPATQDCDYSEIDAAEFWKAWRKIGGFGKDSGGSHDRMPDPPKPVKPRSGVMAKRMAMAGVQS